MSSNNPELWTNEDVVRWLETQGLGLYIHGFTRHKINGEALLLLNEKEIKEELNVKVRKREKLFV